MNGAPHLQAVGGDPSQATPQQAARERIVQMRASLRRSRHALLTAIGVMTLLLFVVLAQVSAANVWPVVLTAFWGVGLGFALGVYLALCRMEETTVLLWETLDLLEQTMRLAQRRGSPESREE